MSYADDAQDFPVLDDDEQARIDRDLASPQFVSWQARKEAKHLYDLVRHLYPDDATMLSLAQMAHNCIILLDDEIEARQA